MSTLTLPQMNGSSVYKPSDAWLQASVQEFFSAVNWDDHALVQPSSDSSSATVTTGKSEALNLEMSVSRFFAAINWDGNAIAAPTQINEPTPAKPKQEFTLDDFSDLF